MEDLTHVHPILKKLYSKQKIPKCALAGRIKELLPAWKLLTKDQELLALVEGYQIPLLMEPVQEKDPKVLKLNQEQQKQVDLDVKAMLEKGSISKVCHSKGEFLNSLFLISRKRGGNRPVINLKNLNWFIPYKHFKMEGLHCLKYVLQKGDYMCKIDLKDAYFSVPLHKDSRKLVRFLWVGKLYEFLCLCFGLGPAPRIFEKFLKVPISVLRRLMIRVIIHLDNLLILGNSMSEIFMARDSVIFLLQHLGFVINLKKCVLDPAQDIEFLWLIVNSQTMTLSLPAEKIGKLKDQCLRLYKASKVTLLDLTKLIGTLSSTIQVVLPARLQFRFLQQQQTVSLKQSQFYLTLVKLTPMAKNEFLWWVNNLELCNGQLVIQPEAQVLIQTDASKKGWGMYVEGSERGSVVQEGTGSTYQSAGTFSHKVCHFDICQNVENVSHAYSGRQHDSIELSAENGRDKESRTNADLKGNLGVSTWAWVTITAKYLPGSLNYKADWESRHQKDSSE